MGVIKSLNLSFLIDKKKGFRQTLKFLLRLTLCDRCLWALVFLIASSFAVGLKPSGTSYMVRTTVGRGSLLLGPARICHLTMVLWPHTLCMSLLMVTQRRPLSLAFTDPHASVSAMTLNGPSLALCAIVLAPGGAHCSPATFSGSWVTSGWGRAAILTHLCFHLSPVIPTTWYAEISRWQHCGFLEFQAGRWDGWCTGPPNSWIPQTQSGVSMIFPA